ncbi:tyrosine-type recombinase/integrase [Bosea sp. (in: a-proteobacteria)]|uniref:tyrosine-type recombinase/integrase n=1 Tax=Bosea sp. (in: a-proteobacteria) TaxID=1871050 RepID=UPI00273744CB|nr:tyrosine-type recombinase/integrase [Bosea sp. (in: a-proteobacteria)]MDP3408055.1 tyrosine-type recombinase/integrase [Bosea sp. (in: a-proteobacteria)]
MPRPIKPPRLDVDEKRGKYIIRDTDPATGKPVKRRLDVRAGDDRAAQAALGAYLLERERIQRELDFAAPPDDDPTTSDPRLVSIERCLVFYGQRQIGTPNQNLAGYHMAHLMRHWGGKNLAQVRGVTCRAYVDKRTAEVFVPKGAKAGKPVSPATARRELETLSAAIGAWHKEFTLTARPQVTLPAKADASPDWLTDSEYAAILRIAQGERIVSVDGVRTWERSGEPLPHLERFLEIGFATGTRSAAILGLGWERDPEGIRGWIDFGAMTIHRSGAKAVKTRKRQPACRIPDRLLPRLVEWREADRKLAAELAKEGVTLPNRIVRYQGQPIARIGQAFEAAAKLADLGKRDIDGSDRLAEGGPGTPTPHILRHSRATLLLRAGVAPAEVAEFLGMSMKMLLETYGHHHVEYQKAAAAAA